MTNLKVNYLGKELKNPIIVSSSGLTNSVEKIKEIENNGGAAVVLKSLFEEQITFEAGKEIANQGLDKYPEAKSVMKNYAKDNSIGEYLKLIEGSKKSVNIPVFASINCVNAADWVKFTKKIEDAGADGIELNINIVPTIRRESSEYYENIYFDIIDKVKQETKLPIAVKIGPFFTNPLNFVGKLHFDKKINAVVLFNHFYQPDIDIDNLTFTSADVFTTSKEINNALRWTGIISSDMRLDISASSGIYEAKDVIKLILAGANTTQVCSVLYKKGIAHIKDLVEGLEKWMKDKNYNSISDFKGKMNYSANADAQVYERSQFMKYYSSME